MFIMTNDKKDLLSEVAETIKHHPIKSMIAYDILTPKERKKEINDGIATYLIAFIMLDFFCGPKFFDQIALFYMSTIFLAKLKPRKTLKKIKTSTRGFKNPSMDNVHWHMDIGT